MIVTGKKELNGGPVGVGAVDALGKDWPGLPGRLRAETGYTHFKSVLDFITYFRESVVAPVPACWDHVADIKLVKKINCIVFVLFVLMEFISRRIVK